MSADVGRGRVGLSSVGLCSVGLGRLSLSSVGLTGVRLSSADLSSVGLSSVGAHLHRYDWAGSSSSNVKDRELFDEIFGNKQPGGLTLFESWKARERMPSHAQLS